MNKMWIIKRAKSCIALLPVFGLSSAANAQYYYKDILVTAQISATFQLQKANKVSMVKVAPFESNSPANDALSIEQTLDHSKNIVTTYSKTIDAGESWLTSYYSKSGALVKTVDSTDEVTTNTEYTYDNGGRLSVISSKSVTKDNFSETEVHSWKYNADGKPEKMIKIKNGSDTTFITLTADEQGNIGEEAATRNRYSLGITYYYYDDQHRLTDVARYNKKADRILPDYMFAYNATGQLVQMIIVPEGSSEYQTWKYTYNQQGLRNQELCYNKQKQMVGKIEYSYSFNW